MKTYTNGRDLMADVFRRVPGEVYVKVQVDILAAMLGHRFVGPNGDVISMEQVAIGEDPEERLTMARPLVVVVSRANT